MLPQSKMLTFPSVTMSVDIFLVKKKKKSKTLWPITVVHFHVPLERILAID